MFCAWLNVVAGADVVRAPQLVGRSHTLSPPLVFDVCVFCLCADMLACAGTVLQRSPVAPETRQAACESHCGEACWLLFCAAFKVLVCDEGCIATLLAFVLRRVG